MRMFLVERRRLMPGNAANVHSRMASALSLLPQPILSRFGYAVPRIRIQHANPLPHCFVRFADPRGSIAY
jgi:hypothetical protein